MVQRFAVNLLASNGGDPSMVPAWSGTDFDSIYVIKLTQTKGQTLISFKVDHEGLDGLPQGCPKL
jgi:hypothetical protein